MCNTKQEKKDKYFQKEIECGNLLCDMINDQKRTTGLLSRKESARDKNSGWTQIVEEKILLP